MLQALRDKTARWIAPTILGLLIIPFALFGIEQYVGGRNDTYVARIQAPPTWWKSAPSFWPLSKLWTTDDISQQDFRQQFDQMRQQQRQSLGDAFDSQQFESADNKRKVLDQMIDVRVMLLATSRNGISVSDASVQKTINAIPNFQVNGKFDLATYQRTLATLQPPTTPEVFEAQIRDGLRREALAGRIALSDFVTPAEASRLTNALTEQREVQIVAIPAAVDTSPVSDAEAKAWYDAHGAQYMQPVQATFEVVDGDPAKITSSTIDEAQLRKQYDTDKAKYVAGNQRLASHILVAVAKDAKPEVVAAAKAKAEQLDEQAKAPGADFAALAKANSDDTGSKAKGGDLGWVAQDGSMVKPFEDALFATPKGAISAPVRSAFGFHIIQVRDIKEGKVTTFEEARPEIEKALAKTAGAKALNTSMGVLADEAYKNPASFAATAVAQKLPFEKIGPVVPAAVQGILAEPQVRRVAFSDNLLKNKGVSDPITITPGHSVMVHVVDYTPARQRPLVEVHDQVIADVRADRASKAAAARADAMIKAIAAGQTMAQVAAAQSLAVQPAATLPRGNVPTPAVNKAIFSIARPGAGKQSAGKVQLPDGGWAVFAVSAVKPGDPAAFPPEARAGLMQQIAQANGQASADGYVKATRKLFKVTVAEDRL
ncbi:SurA N-terminal domain-containing protein [Solilutibacter silvestris]|uniref:Periplasmic chaperone PpiD n=1 Tax=Solilutibacter silvestris TaxID=1645665 RepID=A0A2K1PZT5_9GAMM|nr:SurA N-terminal domain-containing protein [Lysobacter silvestris]PNS08292.1 PPIC-type PPIASE domain-containing protein [Lysobacter silvestris]